MIMNIYSLLDVVVQLKHRVLLRAPAQPVAVRCGPKSPHALPTFGGK